MNFVNSLIVAVHIFAPTWQFFLAAPGGTVITDGDSTKPCRTNTCVFCAPDNVEVMRGYAQVWNINS